MNMKRWKSFLSVVLLLSLLLSFFAVVNGCGKKGPPLPPESSTWFKN